MITHLTRLRNSQI